MPIRVADDIAATLARHGIRHVFMVTGGGAMHLNDALGRNKSLEVVCCHHEQACAIAAESYFRMTSRLAAVNVTTGPGGINALNGVWGAYVDSLGMVVISGQVKWETVVRSTPLPLRQLGDQEFDIASFVAPITKYAEMVTDPKTIRFHMEKAIHLARSGRPGPTWLDIPMNVQGAMIDERDLAGFDPAEIERPATDVRAAARDVAERLRQAKRPVVFAGAGVRISGAADAFIRLVDKLGIPVVTGFNAHDAIWNAHPLYVGRPSTVGDRAGNFAVQNADFLLVLGSRLNIRQVSYAWQNFARAAYKVMVDIDPAEMAKPTLKIDLPIHADLADFIPALENAATGPTPAHREYLAWCRERRAKYPVVLPEYWSKPEPVNPYCFVEALYRALPDDVNVVTGDGTAVVATFQAANLKRGQRLYSNSGCASMGYDLPAALGASIAMGRKRVVCIAGDGSIMMNLQELQTIVTQKLPIKVFVLSNQGYHSIRQTQQNYFADNVIGCGTDSGLGFPDFEKLAAAFGYRYARIARHVDLEPRIRDTLAGDEPALCEVVLDLEQPFAPKLSSRKLPDGRMVSSPLEDLAPFLDRDELRSNMLIPLLEE